jgi:hypothetical protein
MGGNSKGIYKQSAGENLVGDSSRLGAWDRNGPYCDAFTTYPMMQVGHTAMLAIT